MELPGATICGVVAAAVNVVMFAAPTASIVTAVRELDYRRVPFAFTVVCLASGLVWSAFAILAGDAFLLTPNVIGTVLSSAQLVALGYIRWKVGAGGVPSIKLGGDAEGGKAAAVVGAIFSPSESLERGEACVPPTTDSVPSLVGGGCGEQPLPSGVAALAVLNPDGVGGSSHSSSSSSSSGSNRTEENPHDGGAAVPPPVVANRNVPSADVGDVGKEADGTTAAAVVTGDAASPKGWGRFIPSSLAKLRQGSSRLALI